MYECLIKKYDEDDSVSYEYYSNEYDAIPKAPHIKIPEGAEYLLCHEGISNQELIFGKNNFEYNWSVTYSDTTWKKSIWDGHIIDRLEYMRRRYGSIVLWKREDKSMNENKYLLTKLQACEVLLSRKSVLQFQSVDGSWIDFKPSVSKSNAHLYTILFNLDDTKFRIKPEWEHIPIEFSEVMDMLTDNRGNEIFINKEANLEGADNPLFYLQHHYHDKYSRVVEKQLTYEEWKNSVDLKTSLK